MHRPNLVGVEAMPRQARLDRPGTLYHVMVRDIEKRQIVDDGPDRRDFVRRLGALAEECNKCGVSLTELRSGSRGGRLTTLRTKIVRELVENYGVGVADVTRHVGISTSGVSKILTRTLSS